MGQIPLKRIQFGLTGLAFALTLVILGTLVVQQPDEGEAASAVVEPAEPLSQIGATPGVAAEPEPAPPQERIAVPIDPNAERLIGRGEGVARPAPRSTPPADDDR